MAAAEEAMTANIGDEQTKHPATTTISAIPEVDPTIRDGEQNGRTTEERISTGSKEEAGSEIDPANESKARLLPITKDADSTTHLPSPLPSPTRSDLNRASVVSAYPIAPPDAPTHGSYGLGLIDTSFGGMDFDMAQGVASCAVSEADTDALSSAVESSSEALPLQAADTQATPKKDVRRASSTTKRTRERSSTKSSEQSAIRRLSASKIQELTASPDSLPVASVRDQPLSASAVETGSMAPPMASHFASPLPPYRTFDKIETSKSEAFGDTPLVRAMHSERPTLSSRMTTTPALHRKSVSQNQAPVSSSRRNSFQPSPRPLPLNLDSNSNFLPSDPAKSHVSDAHNRHESRDSRESRDTRAPSPIPPVFPIPPLSAPTFLQLELAAQRPSPLYIHQTYGSDIPYESSAVKFERLKNFLLIPPFLERTLMIGALACLDAWLWTLTILPMRFVLAVKVLAGWWGYVIAKEARWLVAFVWEGLGRMWKRGREGRSRGLSRVQSYDSTRSSEPPSRSPSRAREPLKEVNANGSSTGHNVSIGDAMKRSESARLRATGNGLTLPSQTKPRSRTGPSRHKRTKSTPSDLSSFHKADLLQFAVMVVSSLILTQLDASRMYHFIRAQSAVKLYVIYNLVEVGDRLLSALGQDIFECLFSSETLSRNSLGRSKVMLPFGMFCLALVYNCAHAITLFYQVITLNVAVNSYSNALLTLLMSNQFVEIKGSVFKKFEKENLFQLTCADVVERFQLWIVLLIIGMRNVVEVGGLSVPGAGIELGDDGSTAKVPLHNPSILPSSFTILPSWLWSGEVLSPFLVVIASEMLVDWIKHGYINKFNNIKPNFYSRVLDILCKDYYTNAFVAPTLTRRLGLPLLPLSTLFIRACFQTYHMFLATHMPAPMPPSTQTSLSVESSTPTSPAVTAALERLDHVIRHALGRSVYGIEGDIGGNTTSQEPLDRFTWGAWSSDDAIALVTLVMVVFIVWLFLLLIKLFLGMFLLRYSRDRYARMRLKEHAVAVGKAEPDSFDAKGRRVGGFGAVELGDDRRRWIYADDPEGLRKARERERKMEEKREKGGDGERGLEGVTRYEMVAKRIW